MSEIDPAALRGVIRELLNDVLSELTSGAHNMADEVRTVHISDGPSLDAFVAQFVDLCETPQQREAIRDGRLRFRLATSSDTPSTSPGRRAAMVRVERGALTEKAVIAAAKAGQSIRLGCRAIATPLALERARALGVDVQKETE